MHACTANSSSLAHTAASGTSRTAPGTGAQQQCGGVSAVARPAPAWGNFAPISSGGSPFGRPACSSASSRPARRRQPSVVTVALPPAQPSRDSMDPELVAPMVQQLWQSVLDAGGGQPAGDAAADTLNSFGASARRMLLALHLLRCGCNSAQLAASTSAADATSAALAPAQRQPEPQPALSVAAKDPGGGSSPGSAASNGRGGGRGAAVQTAGAAAEIAAGQAEPEPKGGGGDGRAAKARQPDIGTLWGLLVLGLAYVHHSTTGFALPALLPLINEDLHLTDGQGALLTSGYTVRRPFGAAGFCHPYCILVPGCYCSIKPPGGVPLPHANAHGCSYRWPLGLTIGEWNRLSFANDLRSFSKMAAPPDPFALMT